MPQIDADIHSGNGITGGMKNANRVGGDRQLPAIQFRWN